MYEDVIHQSTEEKYSSVDEQKSQAQQSIKTKSVGLSQKEIASQHLQQLDTEEQYTEPNEELPNSEEKQRETDKHRSEEGYSEQFEEAVRNQSSVEKEPEA